MKKRFQVELQRSPTAVTPMIFQNTCWTLKPLGYGGLKVHEQARNLICDECPAILQGSICRNDTEMLLNHK